MNASKQQESEQNIANFSGNWPEDFGSENGNYMNACQDCGRHFLGHKRRFTCRLCWLAKTNPDNYDTPTPATPSADEEIERTVFKCTGCGKKEDITAIIAQPRDFVREDYLNALNAIAAIVSPATEFQCGMDYVVAVEQYAADTLQTEQTLAAREGELATQKQLIAQYELDGFADEKIITDLKAELATAQKCCQQWREKWEHQNSVLTAWQTEVESLRSHLTEAQAKLKESEEGYIIVAKADELIKQTLTAQITEANTKLAEAANVIRYVYYARLPLGDKVEDHMPIEWQQKVTQLLTRLSP